MAIVSSTLTTSNWEWLVFNVPAGSFIKRIQVSYTYTATAVVFPAGPVKPYIAGTVRSGIDSWGSVLVQSSSWGFTLDNPLLCANGVTEVFSDGSIDAPTHTTEIISRSASIEYEPSVLVLPFAMAF